MFVLPTTCSDVTAEEPMVAGITDHAAVTAEIRQSG